MPHLETQDLRYKGDMAHENVPRTCHGHTQEKKKVFKYHHFTSPHAPAAAYCSAAAFSTTHDMNLISRGSLPQSGPEAQVIDQLREVGPQSLQSVPRRSEARAAPQQVAA